MWIFIFRKKKSLFLKSRYLCGLLELFFLAIFIIISDSKQPVWLFLLLILLSVTTHMWIGGGRFILWLIFKIPGYRYINYLPSEKSNAFISTSKQIELNVSIYKYENLVYVCIWLLLIIFIIIWHNTIVIFEIYLYWLWKNKVNIQKALLWNILLGFGFGVGVRL